MSFIQLTLMSLLHHNAIPHLNEIREALSTEQPEPLFDNSDEFVFDQQRLPVIGYLGIVGPAEDETDKKPLL